MADYRDYIPDEISETRSEAAKLGHKASELGAKAFSFPQKLREAVQKKYNYNKDIIDKQSKAQAEYFAAPAVAREKYVKQPGEEGYVTPQQAESLVAQEKAQAYAPYASLTDILGQRMGSISDIIGEGTGAYQAEVAAAQGAAQVAQQAFNQLLQEYQLGSSLQQQDWQQQYQEEQLANQLAQWEEEQARLEEQTDWERPWQERLWEYQLNQPYYKPTTEEEDGGGLGTIDPADLEQALREVEESFQTEDLSAGQSSWTPPESSYPGYTNPYGQ